MTLQALVEMMVSEVNENMKTAFPGIEIGSGAYIETDPENIEGCLHEDKDKMRPGDVCIAYDWMSDELTPQQTRIFHMIFGNFFDLVSTNTITIADADGSGNGLFYGLVAVRQRSTTIKVK
jgi:hypothetical protein